MNRREKCMGWWEVRVKGSSTYKYFFFSLNVRICKVLTILFITSDIRRVHKNNVCKKAHPDWPTEDT